MSVDEDYKEIFRYIYEAAKNDNDEALFKLMDILKPLTAKYSKNNYNGKLDNELYDEMTFKLCRAIREFKIM